MKTKIKIQIFVAILVLTLAPVTTAYFLAGDILSRSLNLGFNEDVTRMIESHQSRLKELRRLQPERAELLKSEFEDSRRLQAVFQDGENVKHALNQSLLTYFWVGFLAAIGVALITASALGRSISKSFTKTVDELIGQRERVRYLEDVSQWQDVARKLAHEIKGPLTPIELLVSGLPRSFETAPKEKFASQLEETRRIVSDEVAHLRRLVHHFSGFSQLPAVQLSSVKIHEFIESYICTYQSSWSGLSIDFTSSVTHSNENVLMDPGLFRQVLTNLLNNAAEANPDVPIRVRIRLQQDERHWSIEVSNTGAAIPSSIRERIFQPYFSTKAGEENLGLGLSIAKKIIVDHGGDIRCQEREEGASFVIEIPKVRGP